MDNERKWLCTFEINNFQDEYAKLMRFIIWLEELKKNEFKKYDEEFVDFYISRTQFELNMSASSRIPYLIETEMNISENKKKYVRLITTSSNFLQVAKDFDNKFYYFIRVNLVQDESDIAELRFLILMLQMLPSITGKISVQIKKHSQWSSADYYRISDYLRLQQRRYNCFYACTGANISSLSMIKDTSPWTQSTFVPLIEVNNSFCRAINKTIYIETKYQNEAFNKLFQAIRIKEKDTDEFVMLMFRIAIRIMLKRLPGRKYVKEESKRGLLDIICRIVNETQGVTILDLLFWGAVIPKGIQLEYAIGKELLGRVQSFTFAVGQILENVVYHSEFGKGVFTVRVQKNEDYLNRCYPEQMYLKRGSLELFIADGNMQDGMTYHFLNSSKADAALRQNKTSIELKHLFGDIDSADLIKTVWEKCRDKHPEMCHGLIAFSNGIHNLKGAIKVRSSANFTGIDKKEYYYFNGSRCSELHNVTNKFFIPGTQYSIAVNDAEFCKSESIQHQTSQMQDWAFDFDRLTYSTTYQDLGKSLHFGNEAVPVNADEVIAIVNNSKGYIKEDLYNQEKKDQSVSSYLLWINSVFKKEKQVYALDLEPINQAINDQRELWEPFCKGLLGCDLFVKHVPRELAQNGTEGSELANHIIILLNPSAQFSLVFWEMLQSFIKTENFSTEHCNIYFYPHQLVGNRLFYSNATMYDLLNQDINKSVYPRVFPYTLFLKNERGQTIFEEELIKQATHSIYEKSEQGYKLDNTHMRLGNKVHIDAFFEMALFFENPNYAYYTAFLFLRKLINNLKALDHKKIVFYGYSSYSRSIVWAVISILKEYFGDNCPKIEFVIYQNDLKLESDQASVQMYYSNVDWQRDHKMVWKADEALMVFIVPISSSLTTFNKMAAELERETGNRYEDNMYYTALWVRNINNSNKGENIYPTEEEKEYWKNANVKEKTINSQMVESNNCIYYLADVTCLWQDPLKCEKCFPDDPIMEYPLVETDPTSTVPTQQYYLNNQITLYPKMEETKEELENNRRVWLLKNNLIYGHISKSGSHYQYYFKVREYFQQQKENIKDWLKKLREVKEEQEKDPFSKNVNIIIVPQQTNNMEFAQFVYEYYFHGNAECIIVNTEKEFRSNLQAEYSGLFSRVLNSGKTVKFYYVDVAINSGSSYNRAVSLVSSCLRGANPGFKKFCIDRVFLLISRMSDPSKESFVRDAKNHFHAYVNVDISAMRVFGDSCVPCKIQEEARNFYKKAATPSVSAYWENKVYDRRCVSFDNVKETGLMTQEDGFRRMICSHRAAHYLRPIRGADVKFYFEAIKYFLSEICYAKPENSIYMDISDDSRKEWLAAGLKILVRPFFSYDYKMRCAVIDLYLIISEMLVKNKKGEDIKERIIESCDKNKQYLINYISWIEELAERISSYFGESQNAKKSGEYLDYIRNNILKGLADIKSNYLLRKDTIIELTNQLGNTYNEETHEHTQLIREYFLHYIRTILRMTHSSSDETKSVWLECLLQTGFEYKIAEAKRKNNTKLNGEEEFCSQINENVRNEFRRFRKVLLVENNRPLYQAVNDFGKVIEDTDKEKKWEEWGKEEKYIKLERLYGQYHMKNAKLFLDYQKSNKVKNIIPMYDLLRLLNSEEFLPTGEERYLRLGDKINKIVNSVAEYGKVIVFGENEGKYSALDEYLGLSAYFILYPAEMAKELAHDKTKDTRELEEKWKKVNSKEEYKEELNHNGFYLFKNDNENNISIFIKLDNNYMELRFEEKKAEHQRIEPIYMFISCLSDDQNALHLIRCILMFRQKLVEWLERDFNNNTIADLLKQKHLSRLLSMDKMGDHAEMDFVGCHQRTLAMVTGDEYEKEKLKGTWLVRIGESGELVNVRPSGCSKHLRLETIDHMKMRELEEWFLMRAYINSRISRLFRTMARMGNEFSGTEPTEIELSETELYYNEEEQGIYLRPARNLGHMFFAAMRTGETRKNYLRQMAKVIVFQVEGVWDYDEIIVDNRKNQDEIIEDRLQKLYSLLKKYNIIHFVGRYGEKYSYLSEYLIVSLLDCFVSGFKVCKEWSKSDWGGEVFLNMIEKSAMEKCEIRIHRSPGAEYNGIKYDYLEISNDIYPRKETGRRGPGMSEAAKRWYIEGLWRILNGNSEYPRVLVKSEAKQYTILLPILERKDDT